MASRTFSVTQWCYAGRKGGRDHEQEPQLRRQESYSATTTQSSPQDSQCRRGVTATGMPASPRGGCEQTRAMWAVCLALALLVTATKSPMGYSLGLTNTSGFADGTEMKGSPVGRAHRPPLARAAGINLAQHSSALPP